MESLLKSDVFFFITSVVVILIGTASVVASVYVINILRDVRDVSKTIKKGTQDIAEDISDLRGRAREGRIVAGIFGFIKSLFSRRKKRR